MLKKIWYFYKTDIILRKPSFGTINFNITLKKVEKKNIINLKFNGFNYKLN